MTRSAPDRARAGSPSIVCRVVGGPAELAEHHRIRQAVFVAEQGVFTGTDVDAHDARDDVVHVLAWAGSEAVGTVRLYPLDPRTGLWQGDRLAVMPSSRAAGAGGPLVRFAVSTASGAGGRAMLAHVQLPNRRFFERLGWTAGETEIYAGLPHVSMSIGFA